MKRQRMIAVLPTLLTLGNGACGFGAITFAAKLGPEHAEGRHLLVASLLIFLGMLFDMLDGSAARLTKQTSDIGAQLDSLCDAITFGVAPAFLMLQFVRHEYMAGECNSQVLRRIRRSVLVDGCCVCTCYVRSCRLARFNVETEEEDTHEHRLAVCPSPAAAGALASFPIGMRELLRIATTTESHKLATWLVPSVKVAMVASDVRRSPA